MERFSNLHYCTFNYYRSVVMLNILEVITGDWETGHALETTIWCKTFLDSLGGNKFYL